MLLIYKIVTLADETIVIRDNIVFEAIIARLYIHGIIIVFLAPKLPKVLKAPRAPRGPH